MSSSDRRDRYALIVLACALAALVAVVALTQPPDAQVAQPGNADVTQYEYRDVAQLVAAIRDFDPWEDTAAQWAMAIFAAAATGLSLYGVRLLKQTLDANAAAANAATRAAEAATAANEIARKEQRPWVTLRREIPCKLTLSDIPPEREASGKWDLTVGVEWKYDLENVGRSPAFQIRVKQQIVSLPSHFDGEDALREFVKRIQKSSIRRGDDTIFPGDKADMRASLLAAAIKHDHTSELTLGIMFAVTYRSQEGDMTGLEARYLAIDFDQSIHGPWHANLLEFSDYRITR